MGRRPPLVLVGIAFTVSGFTSLVLEVVWSKALALMLGSALHAVSTVVAAYLGGLALGAYLAGRVAPRLARPLAAYGFLEVGVGLYALASLLLFAALDPVVGRAYAGLGATSAAYFAVRVALATLVLLPPTILMGATLPCLVAWAMRAGGSLGRSLGTLYGLNTLGAVLGAALAGFWLVPGLGLLGSTRAAGAVALVVGSAMAVLGSRERSRRAEQEETEPPAMQAPATTPRGRAPASTLRAPAAAAHAPCPTRPLRLGLAIALFGFSGAVALALEITWTRMFSLVFGSSVYSFALVLASYLLALALGSLLWGGRLADARNPWRSFAVLQATVCAGAAIGLWLLPVLPAGFLGILLANRGRLPVLYAGEVGLVSLVTFLPCLAFGALFPVGARLVSGDRMSGARATGLSYAVNTAGTLSGTLLAGFWLLPTFGIRATWVGSGLVSLSLAAVAWWIPAAASEARPDPAAPRAKTKSSRPDASRGARPSLAWAGSVGAIAILGLLAGVTLISPPWNKALFTLGVYRTSIALAGGASAPAGAAANLKRRLASERLLFYREGAHAVVSVHAEASREQNLSLRVNGKPDASTGPDLETQIMIGHLPMLWVPPKANVCVIGLGSGVSAGAALLHDPARLTVVEIEPAVVEASRLFDMVNNRVLADPRVELIVEDGRQHLQHSGRRYDAIISEPSNPWVSGVNNLFTTDYYRRVRAALAPGGVFGQWLQFYELSPAAQSSLLASFAAVFPRAEVFLFGRDLLLVAPPEGRRVAGDQLIVEGSRGPVASYLTRFGLQGGATAASDHLGSISHLVAQLPPAPFNTDDRPFVEYRAPFDMYEVSQPGFAWALAEKDPLAGLRRWVADSSLASVAMAAGLDLARAGLTERAETMASELRRTGGAAVPGALAIAELARRFEGARLAQTWVARAVAALGANDLAAADSMLRRAFAAQPDNPGAHLQAAWGAMRRDDRALAREHLAVTMRWGDMRDRCLAYNVLGIIAMREGRETEGRAAFVAALGTHPGEASSYVNLARVQVQAGHPDSAAAVLENGLARTFPNESILKALEALRGGRSF